MARKASGRPVRRKPLLHVKNNEELAAAAERIIAEAKAAGMTLATAESCTGGALASLLANAPGAGELFHGGFVVYTKENKTAALGISPKLLSERSAVCDQVSQDMAKGALERTPADLTIAITGVAGPEPDEDGNPVGLVYLAAARRDGFITHEEKRFGDCAKDEILRATLAAALALIGKALPKKT